MTFRTVSQDELERLAFESGQPIEIGTYAARLTIGTDHYRARIEPAGGCQVSAVDRIQAFLSERDRMLGLDADHIAGANYAVLLRSDIEELLRLAESGGAA